MREIGFLGHSDSFTKAELSSISAIWFTRFAEMIRFHFMKLRLLKSLLIVVLPLLGGCGKEDWQLGEAKKNVVMVEVTSQTWDYRIPWNPGTVSSARGAGFVIDRKRILTNAHVVSGAR